ncbi:uncharacterized protein [Linepithema humile]|uniref:uncharacterized protein isoform X2 n=1 Tax=Linepithema humile TaxID=83485 RepID=UPI00351ED9C8
MSLLNRVCKRFYNLSNNTLNQKSNHLLVTNKVSAKFCERCKPLLSSYKSKFITHCNWKYEVPYINYYLRDEFVIESIENMKSMKIKDICLKMTENTIWVYVKKKLIAFNRQKDGTFRGKISKFSNSQFSSIAYCNDIIISGHVDGSIRHWKIKSRNNINNIPQLKAHSNVYGEHVSNIEATPQHNISSFSNLIKIQKNSLADDNSAEEDDPIYRGKKLIHSISLDPTGTKVAASAEKSLLIYDIITNCKEMDECINNNTCSQLLWQDPHTILMLYKQQVKKLDIRTPKFVRTLDASVLDSDYELYSFSTDYLYTIITGTNIGTVLLWDQRLNNYIHTYVIHLFSTNPVISVDFDSTHMYAILELEGLFKYSFEKTNYDCAKRKKYFNNFV